MAETVFLQEMLVVFAERMNSQKVHLLARKSPTFLNDGLFSEISKFKELRGEVWE